MATVDAILQLQEFREIVTPGAPLAEFTLLRIGGPAEALATPRTVVELAAFVKACIDRHIPMHVLGAGCNILVNDDGVKGVVLRLSAAQFTQLAVNGQRVRAGCGATVASLISLAAQHNLAGLETLVGIPGTVGGGLRHVVGDRSSDFLQYLRLLEVIDAAGTFQKRERDDLAYSAGSADDPVLVAAEFELEADSPDAIVKRLRKAWIQRKASQPFSFQAAGQIFKNPRGLSAAALIEQAGLVGSRSGGAQVSDRNASCIVADPGTTARDVHRLIDLIRDRVLARFHIELELEISVW